MLGGSERNFRASTIELDFADLFTPLNRSNPHTDSQAAAVSTGSGLFASSGAKDARNTVDSGSANTRTSSNSSFRHTTRARLRRIIDRIRDRVGYTISRSAREGIHRSLFRRREQQFSDDVINTIERVQVEPNDDDVIIIDSSEEEGGLSASGRATSTAVSGRVSFIFDNDGEGDDGADDTPESYEGPHLEFQHSHTTIDPSDRSVEQINREEGVENTSATQRRITIYQHLIERMAHLRIVRGRTETVAEPVIDDRVNNIDFTHPPPAPVIPRAQPRVFTDTVVSSSEVATTTATAISDFSTDISRLSNDNQTEIVVESNELRKHSLNRMLGLSSSLHSGNLSPVVNCSSLLQNKRFRPSNSTSTNLKFFR